jgi:hypothetical protein
MNECGFDKLSPNGGVVEPGTGNEERDAPHPVCAEPVEAFAAVLDGLG